MNSSERVAQWLDQAAEQWGAGKDFHDNEEATSMLNSLEDVLEQGYLSQSLSLTVNQIGKAFSAWRRGLPASHGACNLRAAAELFREVAQRKAAAKAVVDVPEEFIF